MYTPKFPRTFALNCNVGKGEAVVRVLLGLAIFGAGIAFQNWLGLVGLWPFLTGLLRYSPLWKLLGIRTCKGEVTKENL